MTKNLSLLGYIVLLLNAAHNYDFATIGYTLLVLHDIQAKFFTDQHP